MAKEAKGVVLLVEHDATLRRIMDAALTSQGYSVIATWDSLDALEGARVQGGHVRLLVADHDLPRIDALTLADRLTIQHPEIRVLLVSKEKRIASQRGTWSYLGKPFTARQLLGKVEEMLT